MSLMLGSVSTTPSWHGLWLRLIEDTTPARGALASALATRRSERRRRLRTCRSAAAKQCCDRAVCLALWCWWQPPSVRAPPRWSGAHRPCLCRQRRPAWPSCRPPQQPRAPPQPCAWDPWVATRIEFQILGSGLLGANVGRVSATEPVYSGVCLGKPKSGKSHFFRSHTTLKKNLKVGFPTRFPGNG